MSYYQSCDYVLLRHSTTTYVIPNGDRVSTAGSERSTNASVAERLGPPGSAGGGGDRHANSASRDGKAAMPVRISRRDLRRLSTEEITLRKSAITVEESMPAGEKYHINNVINNSHKVLFPWFNT